MSDSVPHNPRFHPEILKAPAEYGILKLLEGTWINHNLSDKKTGWGLHTTCMPSPGTSSETIPGKFTFLCENYSEELTFTLVPGGVRNRAGSNEQICGAVKYDQIIHNENKDLIHVENGMYIWMHKILSHPADDASIKNDIGYPELSSGAIGPVFVPNYTISRSGTIPHGSTISLFGSHTDKAIKGKPKFPVGADTWNFDHLAISKTMGGAGTFTHDKNDPFKINMDPINLDDPAPDWVRDESLPMRCPSGNRTYTQRIFAHRLYPYSVRPDLRLRDAIAHQKIEHHFRITLDSDQDKGPQGGILNIPIIQRYVPTTRMRLNMWLETVLERGQEIQQLQYEQITHFEFHFGTDGGTTVWPHIQVNTLRKVR